MHSMANEMSKPKSRSCFATLLLFDVGGSNLLQVDIIMMALLFNTSSEVWILFVCVRNYF